MNAYYQLLNRTIGPQGEVIAHYCSTVHAQGHGTLMNSIWRLQVA